MARKFMFGDKVKVIKQIGRDVASRQIRTGEVGYVVNYASYKKYPYAVFIGGYNELKFFKVQELTLLERR